MLKRGLVFFTASIVAAMIMSSLASVAAHKPLFAKDDTNEYAKFAQIHVGSFVLQNDFALRADSRDPYVSGYHFKYGAGNKTVHLEVRKYASEAQAQAMVKKRVAAAVPTAQYQRRVRLPKCNPNKETDYHTPEELVKSIQSDRNQLHVFHSRRFWDYACKLNSNREEDVMWSDGVYVLNVDATPPDINSNAFGMGESFAQDYLKAIAK